MKAKKYSFKGKTDVDLTNAEQITHEEFSKHCECMAATKENEDMLRNIIKYYRLNGKYYSTTPRGKYQWL